ncbi:MAG: glycosyltransferase family 2 protein [Armatimonadetes bacterium]|nr:glycosyltransferase family 2 protein [Armatimonadota bacterium]
MTRPSLAVLIPAYNESARIVPTLERLAEFFAGYGETWKVVVVSDGSTDDTNHLVEQFAASHIGFELLAYSPNRGKGFAVRKGMLEVDADFLLFSDADLAAPIEEIAKLRAEITTKIPIAIGSRPLRDSRLEIRQPWYRELLGRVFNKAVQVLAVPGIADTQCGFKLFRSDVAKDIFSRCKLDGFGFDFESLIIARDLGYTIAEVPIRWSHQEGSKVVLLRDGPRMLRDLLKIRLWGKTKRLKQRDEPR